MIISLSTIFADILCFFLIIIAVMRLLHLIDKYCKVNLPQWLKWDKFRTIFSIIVSVLVIIFIIRLCVSYQIADIIDDI